MSKLIRYIILPTGKFTLSQELNLELEVAGSSPAGD